MDANFNKKYFIEFQKNLVGFILLFFSVQHAI